jgi:uncharacterized protein (TIGR02611 family)
VGQEETGGRPRLIERVRERQLTHRSRNRFYRIGFAGVGFLVLGLGIVMLVTPGPGIAVIIVGLGMLALEFSWAERWLERLIDRAEQAIDQVTDGSPAKRAALLTAGILAAAAVVYMVVRFDVPFFPG